MICFKYGRDWVLGHYLLHNQWGALKQGMFWTRSQKEGSGELNVPCQRRFRMFAQKYETLKQFEQGWPLAKSEHKGALVVVRVFLKGHFVKKKNVHPTT